MFCYYAVSKFYDTLFRQNLRFQSPLLSWMQVLPIELEIPTIVLFLMTKTINSRLPYTSLPACVHFMLIFWANIVKNSPYILVYNIKTWSSVASDQTTYLMSKLTLFLLDSALTTELILLEEVYWHFTSPPDVIWITQMT